MDAVVQFLSSLTPWHWFVFGGAMLLIEVFAPTFWFLWTGLAAIVVGALLWFIPDLAWTWQVALFGTMSLALTFLWHAAYRTIPAGKAGRLNNRSKMQIGRRAVVAESFQGGVGPIWLDDTRWQAVSDQDRDLPAGAQVEITGADGAYLRVRRIG